MIILQTVLGGSLGLGIVLGIVVILESFGIPRVPMSLKESGLLALIGILLGIIVSLVV